MRFKIGNKVRVVNPYSGGNFDDGDIVIIERIGFEDEDCYGAISPHDNMMWFLQEDEVAPVTNADRIRAMTDEELADFFYGSPEEEFGICYHCVNFGGASSSEPCKTQHGMCEVEAKNEAFKKWLKQPVKYEF